jgi:hypothetical protein
LRYFLIYASYLNLLLCRYELRENTELSTMYRCQFSTDEQRQIRHERNYHPDPIVRKRMAILWHKHHNLPHYQIAELCDAAPNTVTATIRTYLEKGLTGLQGRQFNCPISQLEPHRALLIACNRSPPSSRHRHERQGGSLQPLAPRRDHLMQVAQG